MEWWDSRMQIKLWTDLLRSRDLVQGWVSVINVKFHKTGISWVTASFGSRSKLMDFIATVCGLARCLWNWQVRLSAYLTGLLVYIRLDLFVINSTEQSPSWEGDRCPASQEIPRIHQSPPPVPILSHINPVHASPSFLKINLIFEISGFRRGWT